MLVVPCTSDFSSSVTANCNNNNNTLYIIARSGDLPGKLIGVLLHVIRVDEPVYKLELQGENALWRHKWVSLTEKGGVLTKTAAESLAACDKQACTAFN